MARGTTTPAGRGRTVSVALLALVTATLAVCLALAASPRTAPASASCRHVNARPHQVSLGKLRAAITCLVEHKRTKHNRGELNPNKRLELAAQRHTGTMLAKNCFKHRCRHEPFLNQRIKKTGYLRHAHRWKFAEDLGYENTPRQMINRWMASGFNRGNILNRRFRDLGVGVGWGTPVADLDDSKFATYTLVFAWRKPPR